MNNLLPRDVKMDYKYDLKGSTHKRAASERERSKATPTYKDNDFIRDWSSGIILPNEVYSALMKTIERDCRVLESFGIMDYRFLSFIGWCKIISPENIPVCFIFNEIKAQRVSNLVYG